MKGENEMEIFIQNLAYYNEGKIVGDWFSLNSSIEDLQQFLKSKVKVDDLHEEYFIATYNLDTLHYIPSEYEDISLLMKAVKMFNNLCVYDQEKVNAVLEFEPIHLCSELIELIQTLDNYDLYHNVHNDYDLGYYWLNESGCFEIPEFLETYLDYNCVGRNYYLESNGCYTSYGYVEMK